MKYTIVEETHPSPYAVKYSVIHRANNRRQVIRKAKQLKTQGRLVTVHDDDGFVDIDTEGK